MSWNSKEKLNTVSDIVKHTGAMLAFPASWQQKCSFSPNRTL